MSNLPAGAQGQPLFTVVAGAVYYSTDGGVTWTEAQAPGSPSNSSAPISGDGTVGTPFTIAAGAIALSKLATQADSTVVGVPVGGGTESPIALTATQLTALINPVTASLPGSVPAGALPAGATIVWAMLRTNVIDLTAAPAAYTFGAELTGGGAFPGYYLVGTITRLVLLTTGGALSTQPVLSIGNDGSFVNMVHSFTFNLATQFSTGAPSAQAIGTNPLATDLLVDMATPAKVNITTAAAGAACVLTGRFYLYGALIPKT